jgi:hypothetical protein
MVVPERPKKGLQEFMNVMKGVDESVPLPVASSSKIAGVGSGSGVEGAVPGEKGWVADGEVKGKGKGKGKMVETVEDVQHAEEVVEEDDDAAWLRRRQNATLQAEGDAPMPVEDVSATRPSL